MNFVKKNWVKLTFVLLLLILGFFGFRSYQAKQAPLQYNPKTDQIIKPIRQNIKEEITLAGSIDAASKVDLRFQTSGILSWVGVKVGDRVKKFQTIATLDRRELQKRLETDFNNYKSSLSTFQDTQDAYKSEKDNLILTDEMKRILDRSQNTLNNSVITYELTQLAMRHSVLTTPISGIVTNVDQSSAGVNITPVNTSFSIIDPESIYFKSQIDQEDVIKIKAGDEAEIILDSFFDTPMESKVTYISFVPVAGQSSTVYEVRFQLPKGNNNPLYRLGMDGDVNILLRESGDALTIPYEALREEDQSKYVLVMDNDKLTKKYITTGIESDSSIEILDGLSENDQIVIKK